MSKSNANKIAVINGAYGGIGKAIALKLSNDGYTLALMGRNIKKLESLRKEINNEYIKIYAADTKEHDQIDHACIKILKDFGHIDVLVNAVGIVPIGSLSEINQEVWKNAIQTCLLGQIHLVTSFSKSMRTAKSGSIILINGVMSIQPDPNFVVSSTLTGAINNFAKAISKDLGTDNVRVNVINPGPTETSLWGNLASKMSGQLNISKQKFMDEVVSSNPLSRIALPDDIANTVAFLCSDGAKFINGAFVTVDGGATYSF